MTDDNPPDIVDNLRGELWDGADTYDLLTVHCGLLDGAADEIERLRLA